MEYANMSNRTATDPALITDDVLGDQQSVLMVVYLELLLHILTQVYKRHLMNLPVVILAITMT